MAENQNILEITHLHMAFGGLMALLDVDFVVPRGVIKAIIGPNGAGKTTLFNIVTGIFPPMSGRVVFKGLEITALKAHQIAALGISRTFQTVELFKNMTVLENVMVGRHTRSRKGIFSAGFRLPSMRREERDIRRHALACLDLVGLGHKAEEEAGGLPLGEQKALEVARAVATEPELLLLDEPAAGLNETETAAAARLFRTLRDRGITIILVEHDMRLVMKVSEEILVLNYGRKIADGPPEEVSADQAVIKAYLGEDIEFA
ncbi:MAG: ABC transporter ATP-binding protein [Pseudomonadota bacterium]